MVLKHRCCGSPQVSAKAAHVGPYSHKFACAGANYRNHCRNLPSHFAATTAGPTQLRPQSWANWPTLQLSPWIDHLHGSIPLDAAREERVDLPWINYHHGSIPIVKICHRILRQRLLAPHNSFHNRGQTGQRCNDYRGVFLNSIPYPLPE